MKNKRLFNKWNRFDRCLGPNLSLLQGGWYLRRGAPLDLQDQRSFLVLKSPLFAACSVGDVNGGTEQGEGEEVEGLRKSKKADPFYSEEKRVQTARVEGAGLRGAAARTARGEMETLRGLEIRRDGEIAAPDEVMLLFW